LSCEIFFFILVASIICGGFFSLNGYHSKKFPSLTPFEDNYKENYKWDQATLFDKDDFTYLPSYAEVLNDPIEINSNDDLNDLKLQGIVTGEGTEENPYIIEDLDIDAGISSPAILIENTDAFLNIRDCTAFNSGDPDEECAAIYISNCSNIKIINCVVDNYGDGITLFDNSFNNILKNNTILSSAGFSSISIESSHHNQILNNILKFSENYAINLGEADNNIIAGNFITDNHGGMQIEESNNNFLSKNEISGSVEYGIKLYSSDENIITRNILIDNRVGIYLWHSSFENLIYFNDIYGKSYTQAYEDDGCTDNQWDNGTTGNYWNNGYIIRYPDATNDGTVWDTPYEIGGEGPGIDHFPLVKSILPSYESPIESYPWLWLSILCITSIAIVIEIQRKKREKFHM